MLAAFSPIAAVAQPSIPIAIIPGNPPGGIGAACATTTRGYLTSTGQIVTCVSSVWTAIGGSSGASATYQLTDLSVTRTSSTVLTIGAGCTIATPCNVPFGDSVVPITSSTTATLTSGSGTLYIWADVTPAIKLGIPAAGMAVTGSVTATSIPSTGAPIWKWTATSGTWDVTGGTDLRAFMHGPAKTPIQGTNMSIVETPTSITYNATGGGSYAPKFYSLAQDANNGGGCQYGSGFVFTGGSSFPHRSATQGLGVDNCTVTTPSTGADFIFSVWWDGTTALVANVVWTEATGTAALAQWGVSVACPSAQNSVTYSTPVTGTGTPGSLGAIVTTSITPAMGTGCTGARMIYVKVTNSASGSGTTYTAAIDLIGLAI